MDGLSSAESPLPNRQLSEAEGGRPDHQSATTEWLSEFLQRESTGQNRTLPPPDIQPPEPARISYSRPVLIGLGVLLVVGLLVGGIAGALGPSSLQAGRMIRRAEAWASGLRVPAIAHPPAPAPKAVAISGPAPSSLPERPHRTTPSVANNPVRTVDLPPPVEPHHLVPALAVALPGVPSAPQTLPDGTPMHLRIVYAPSSPMEGLRMEAFASQLRRQMSDIASATASAGSVPDEAVVYFFPQDAVGALRVAAGLSRITKRPEPVALVHASVLPRPGTVEIRLPLKVAKDLSNEGS